MKEDIKPREMWDQLERRGYVVLSDLEFDTASFLDYAYKFGQVIPAGRGENLITQIHTTASTGEKYVPLHNDKSYWRIPPRHLLFYIREQEISAGGSMELANIRDAFHSLSKPDQRSIQMTRLTIQSPSNRDPIEWEANIVGTVDNTVYFRFRTDLAKKQTCALSRWHKAISNQKKPVPMKKGDLLILNNWIMAHGRELTEFEETGHRLAYRALTI